MKIKEGFKLRTVGGEHIVAGEGLQQINFNKLIALNASAAYLWQEVEGEEFDEQILAGLLTAKYNISADQALNDATEVMDAWARAEIIAE